MQTERPIGATASDLYFANMTGQELVAACEKRFDSHIKRLKMTGQMRRMLRSWNTYFAFDPNQSGRGGDTTSMSAGGRQGETTLIKPNRYRGIMQRLLNMNAGAAPSWDCVAVNSDSQSSRQAGIGDNVIEHYGSAFKLFERLLERDEHAFVMSCAYMFAPWDPNRGDVHTYRDEPVMDDDGNPQMEDVPAEQVTAPEGMSAQMQETAPAEPQPSAAEPGTPDVGAMPQLPQQRPVTRKVPVFKGDFKFLILTDLDCATEAYSEDRDRPNWTVLRYAVNKWDLAAQYPDFADKIRESQSVSDDREKLGFALRIDDDDSINVYEMYHARTPACPGGRVVRFLRGMEEPLIEGPLPYKNLPVFRTAPGDVILAEGSHTPGFDVIQICEAHASVLSTALSNQASFGKQTMRVSKNSGLAVRNLGGVNFIELDDSAKLEPIVFQSTMGDSIQLSEMLASEEDFTTGLNAAARGDSEAMKGDSGSKGALVLSAAQQMQSRFQRSRQLADSMLFTHIIDTLKTHATVERMIEIAGKGKTYDSMTFVGDDFSGISRVYVHPSDPGKDTSEGRQKRLAMYMEMGLIKTPEDVYMVETTGRLDHVEHAYTAQRMLIDQENEMLADPSADPPPVLPNDPHDMHIDGHMVVPTAMNIRTNAALLKRYMEHDAQHRAMKMQLAAMQQGVTEPQPPIGGDKAGAKKMAAMSGPGPAPAKPPVNPATGQQADLSGNKPPELQPQVAS